MPGFGTNTANAVDPVLTGIWYEKRQDLSLFVGDRVLPMRQLDGLSGQYLKRTGRNGLSLDRTQDPINRTLPLSLQAPSRPMGVRYELGTVSLDKYAEHAFIDERTARHWRTSHDADIIEVQVNDLITMVHAVHEYHVFQTICGDSGNFGATSDPGNLNTASTPILKPLQTAKRTVSKAIRRQANLAVLNEEVHDALLWNVDVMNRPVAMGNAEAQHATPEQLRAWFKSMLGLDLVVVNSYYENASGVDTPYLDDRIIVCYSGTDGASWGNTFTEPNGLESDRATLAGLREVDTDDPVGVKIIADVMYKPQVENAEAAYALTGVLSS